MYQNFSVCFVGTMCQLRAIGRLFEQTTQLPVHGISRKVSSHSNYGNSLCITVPKIDVMMYLIYSSLQFPLITFIC